LGLGGPPDPIASATRGVVEGVLEWTSERIGYLVARIQGHSAAVASDPIRLESVRRATKSEEARFLKEYITDPIQRRVIDDGLTLHDLGEDPDNHQRLKSIRNDLYHSLGTKELRGAEVVERGVLGLFIRQLMREGRSHADIAASAHALLETVERWTYFVQATDRVPSVIGEVKSRVIANQPAVFIVMGHGNQKLRAQAVVAGVLRKLPRGFAAQTHDTGREYVAFIGRESDHGFELRVPA
jgi:hypothetical protein